MSFVKVASQNEIKEGSLLKVEFAGRPIVLAKVDGKVYAMDAVCSHEGGPLEEGTLQGHELKCPWHYAIFDVRNAKVSDQTVWATDLQSYPVKVDDTTGEILIRLDPTQQRAPKAEKQAAEGQENEKEFYAEEERKASDKLTLKLLAKEKLEGTDIMTFRLERGGLNYVAGQFAYFKLDDVKEDPKGPIRHFTIASSPTEKELLISTRIRDTPYKKKLASLESGTEIRAWGPQGEFVLHGDNSKPAIFLSGGIGVTPFRSMIKYATDSQLPIKIIMFDSNRNQENILYMKEFDQWAAKNKNLKIVYALTDQSPSGWKGEKGRIDKNMIERHVSGEALANSIFYVCGPPGMLDAMKQLLQKDLQIPKERMKIEEFTGY